MNGEEMAREPFLDPPMTLADRERALHGGPRWDTENAGRGLLRPHYWQGAGMDRGDERSEIDARKR